MVPKLLHSGGHSLCHSGNGIREWSGNRCMFAIDFPAKKQETLTLLHTVKLIARLAQQSSDSAMGCKSLGRQYDSVCRPSYV